MDLSRGGILGKNTILQEDVMKQTLKVLIGIALATAILLSQFSLGGISMFASEKSNTTNFVTSKVDIDELLRRDYVDNVPLGFNENVFSLYQPGWGFDRNDIYRTGVSGGWGMPVTVMVDGVSVPVTSAEFIPSYVTSVGSGAYENTATVKRLQSTVQCSFDQTKWKQHLSYAFDGIIPSVGTEHGANWNTYDDPLRVGDEWVSVEFSEKVTLYSVNLYPVVDNASCALFTDAVVQYWTGFHWVDVSNQVNPTFVNDKNTITFDGATSNRFRIVITPAEGKAFAFKEIEFLNADGQNLALGAVKQEVSAATPTVYTSFDQTTWGQGLGFAFDGVWGKTGRGTSWTNFVSATAPRTVDEWVTIDFTEAVTVSSLNLYPFIDANCVLPAKVLVQTWTGSDWSNVSNQVNPTFFAGAKNTITFDAVTGTRFRIVITPAAGKAISFHEIELLDSAGNNLTLGAQKVAPPSLSAIVTPSFDQTKWRQNLIYAFDGVTNKTGHYTNWNCFDTPLRSGDEWVTIDFSEIVTISSVNLYPLVDNADCALFTNAVVQYWSDGDWKNVENQINPTFVDGLNHITFDPISGARFRILITPAANKTIGFKEIEFLDPTGTNLSLNATKQAVVDTNIAKLSYTASYDANNTVKKLFDGITDGDIWSTAGSTVTAGFEWVEVSYPETVSVDFLDLYFVQNDTCALPTAVGFQVWNGTAWADVPGLTQPEAYKVGKNTLSFDTVSGSKFRVTVTPASGKGIGLAEVELNRYLTSKDVKITGYKYISPDDCAVVILQVNNTGTANAVVSVNATSNVTTASGNTLVGTAAGFPITVMGDAGFTANGNNLVRTETLAPGATAEYRIVMSMSEDSKESYFTDATPLETQKETFHQWFIDTIPYLDVPDEQIKQIYYFRWYTYRNHIRMTTDNYYVITEFLINVGWASLHNTINCSAPMHVAEGRWLRNDAYLDDYLYHWMEPYYDSTEKNKWRYSDWLANAFYERYLVNQDKTVLNYVDKFKDLYTMWVENRYDADMGIFWQYANPDAMENPVGGDGYRGTINGYQYGDALAIAEMCELVGDTEGAAYYRQLAADLRANVNEKLWNETDKFYKLIRLNQTEQIDAMELYNYVPWMFNLPEDTEEFGSAWSYLMSEDYFWSEYGPRTAELEYAARYLTSDYGGSLCRWNGPSWPFATTQTLVGMANLLNDYKNQNSVDKDDYYQVLKTYAKSHYKNGSPWLAENLDADNGTWIADVKRSPNYNHSEFTNLVITGLMGIRPDDTDVLTVNPLVPEDWDYFCLENVPYHDSLITILYDKDGTHYGQGEGFKIYVDGECKSATQTVAKTQVSLVPVTADVTINATVNLTDNTPADTDVVTLQLLDSNKEVLQEKTGAYGEIRFDAINLGVGEYTYYVKQILPAEVGTVTYDMAEYEITVAVDETGEVTYGNAVVISNLYKLPYAEGKIENGKYVVTATGKATEMGLIKIGNDYYYAGPNGKLIVNQKYYAWRLNENCDIEKGTYYFDAEGKLVSDGIVNGYYYENGKATEKGLIKIGEDYYYAGPNGKLVVNQKYYAWKVENADLPAAWYRFDEAGKMIGSSAEGEIVEINGEKYYYKNGKATEMGLFEYEGAYYVAQYDGKIITGKYYVWKVQDGLDDLNNAWRYFDENGKFLQGICEHPEKGGLYYFENGKVKEMGLFLYEGNYYVAQYDGKIITSENYGSGATAGKYYVWKIDASANDKAKGWYFFNETGKMITE